MPESDEELQSANVRSESLHGAAQLGLKVGTKNESRLQSRSPVQCQRVTGLNRELTTLSAEVEGLRSRCSRDLSNTLDTSTKKRKELEEALKKIQEHSVKYQK